jgi:hypothetical protein
MEILAIFKHASMITVFVFVMMLLVDFIDTASERKMTDIMQGSRWRQYTVASVLGSTPGCLGAFMNVSLYVHGMISFGAIVGGMIATSGDEAFVMLTQFPGTAFALFGLLFFSGLCFAWISDKLVSLLRFIPCERCLENECSHCTNGNEKTVTAVNIFDPKSIISNVRTLSFTRFLLLAFAGSFLFLVAFGAIGPVSWNWKRVTFVILSMTALYIAFVCSEHYLHSHIWDHIIKKHLLRVFLWTFGALFFVHWGLAVWNLESFVRQHMALVLLIGALLGMIPESGPHLVFVMLYAQDLIPFSVLFTTSFVQDGHGMLPLLSYSLKDAILIKALNLCFGLAVGGVLLALGV